MVLTCILDAHHVADILHDTDGTVVTAGVGAYGTQPVVGDHHALRTILHLVCQTVDGVSEMVDILLWLTKEVHRKAQRAARAHSGKGAYGLHGILEEL